MNFRMASKAFHAPMLIAVCLCLTAHAIHAADTTVSPNQSHNASNPTTSSTKGTVSDSSTAIPGTDLPDDDVEDFDEVNKEINTFVEKLRHQLHQPKNPQDDLVYIIKHHEQTETSTKSPTTHERKETSTKTTTIHHEKEETTTKLPTAHHEMGESSTNSPVIHLEKGEDPTEAAENLNSLVAEDGEIDQDVNAEIMSLVKQLGGYTLKPIPSKQTSTTAPAASTDQMDLVDIIRQHQSKETVTTSPKSVQTDDSHSTDRAGGVKEEIMTIVKNMGGKLVSRKPVSGKTEESSQPIAFNYKFSSKNSEKYPGKSSSASTSQHEGFTQEQDESTRPSSDVIASRADDDGLFGLDATVVVVIGASAAGLLVMLAVIVCIVIHCCSSEARLQRKIKKMSLNNELNRWDPQILRPSKENIDAFIFGTPLPSVSEMLSKY